MTRFRAALACVASVLGLVWALGSSAQDASDPTRPVTIIVPFPAGGSADLNARTVAERLSAALGQPFIVENKAGAGGLIAGEAFAKMPPDGYALFTRIAEIIDGDALRRRQGRERFRHYRERGIAPETHNLDDRREA